MSVLDTATLNEVRSIIGQGRLDDLLDLFAEELNARPRAVRDALADHAFARAAAETHSLKGAAANLGADAVAEAARLLEQAISAANGGDRSGVAPSLRRLAAAVSDTQHALAALPRARAPVPLSA
jgi:HPt (histidine-containing phosphotransfer) domain-containing protein